MDKKDSKKVTNISIIILIIGIILGGIFIAIFFIKLNLINPSDQNAINSLENTLSIEKNNLEFKKKEFEIINSETVQYEINLIENALKENNDSCYIDEYKNSTLTASYCNTKNDLKDLKNKIKISSRKKAYPYGLVGVIIIGITLIIDVIMSIKISKKEKLQ